MKPDDAVVARVEGKLRTAARTCWKLEIGAAHFRCLAEPNGEYTLQSKFGDKNWKEITRGAGTPLALLLRLVTTLYKAEGGK